MQSDINLNADLHIHTSYSDGAKGVQHVIERALKKGMTQIAITDHMPLPFENRYAMRPEHLGGYRDKIKRFRDEHADRITIKTGLEMEYIPGYEFWTEEIVRKGWDHAIASIHIIRSRGDHGLVNGAQGEFKRVLKGLFDGDMHAFCTAYYKHLQRMIESGLFHAVGHLDVIKKHNKNNRYFNEGDDWYQDLVLETLTRLESVGLAVEINTGGFYHPVNASYPSNWIIAECLRRGIPLILSSDAHHPRHIGRDFERVRQMIESAPTLS